LTVIYYALDFFLKKQPPNGAPTGNGSPAGTGAGDGEVSGGGGGGGGILPRPRPAPLPSLDGRHEFLKTKVEEVDEERRSVSYERAD